jgi:hypothetical protein
MRAYVFAHVCMCECVCVPVWFQMHDIIACNKPWGKKGALEDAWRERRGDLQARGNVCVKAHIISQALFICCNFSWPWLSEKCRAKGTQLCKRLNMWKWSTILPLTTTLRSNLKHGHNCSPPSVCGSYLLLNYLHLLAACQPASQQTIYFWACYKPTKAELF